MADTNITGASETVSVSAVHGEHTAKGEGVSGVSTAGTAVHGTSDTSFGMLGESETGRGVVALSDADYGLRAASWLSAGIRGRNRKSVTRARSYGSTSATASYPA